MGKIKRKSALLPTQLLVYSCIALIVSRCNSHEFRIRHSDLGSGSEYDYDLAGDLRAALAEDDSECGKAFANPSELRSVRSFRFNGTNRIFNGHEARLGQFPWVVRLRMFTGVLLRASCTGSIVTNRHVLTAAHCVTDCIDGKTKIKDPNLVNALSGRVKTSAMSLIFERADIKFTKMVTPAEFDACNPLPTYDFAVLVTGTPMELRSPSYPDSGISRVCLPKTDVNPHGRRALIAGWGETRFGGGSVNQLLWAEINKIERNCFGEPNLLCAYSDHSAACRGDSGGPLMIESRRGTWIQVAVTSAYDSSMGNCTAKVRISRSVTMEPEQANMFIESGAENSI